MDLFYSATNAYVSCLMLYRFNERIHENDGSVWKDRNIDMSIKNTNNNFWQSVNADTFKHSIAELNPRVKYTPYTRMNNGNVPVSITE